MKDLRIRDEVCSIRLAMQEQGFRKMEVNKDLNAVQARVRNLKNYQINTFVTRQLLLVPRGQ